VFTCNPFLLPAQKFETAGDYFKAKEAYVLAADGFLRCVVAFCTCRVFCQPLTSRTGPKPRLLLAASEILMFCATDAYNPRTHNRIFPIFNPAIRKHSNVNPSHPLIPSSTTAEAPQVNKFDVSNARLDSSASCAAINRACQPLQLLRLFFNRRILWAANQKRQARRQVLGLNTKLSRLLRDRFVLILLVFLSRSCDRYP
jgi:hypothetical protein